MDTELPINMSQVAKMVEEADVFVIGFLLFAERLLVDARVTPEQGPLVKVVPAVSSVEERYRSLRRMRSDLPPPEKFAFFVWPRPVSALDRMSIWGRIKERLEAAGEEGRQACHEAFRELQRLEFSQVMAALTGEGYRSLWDRPPS